LNCRERPAVGTRLTVSTRLAGADAETSVQFLWPKMQAAVITWNASPQCGRGCQQWG
jgi:hypothetical protein